MFTDVQTIANLILILLYTAKVPSSIQFTSKWAIQWAWGGHWWVFGWWLLSWLWLWGSNQLLNQVCVKKWRIIIFCFESINYLLYYPSFVHYCFCNAYTNAHTSIQYMYCIHNILLHILFFFFNLFFLFGNHIFLFHFIPNLFIFLISINFIISWCTF